MKVLLCLFIMMAHTTFAQTQGKSYYLSAEDQKYYKNEPGDGLNTLERVDSTVKEINKLHGEIAAMKAEIQALKKDLEELKSKK